MQTNAGNQNGTSKRSGTKSSDKKVESFSVSTPREYDNGSGPQTYWTTVGRAFKTANGYSLMLDAVPVNGKLFVNLNVTPKAN